jgi:arylsulfatase
MSLLCRAICSFIVLTIGFFATNTSLAKTHSVNARPNFVVVLADDLGFSDLGIYGSEIRTPNLDALAQKGARLTGMRVSPLCAPTRGMLLTGVDNHRTGQGNMYEAIAENQLGKPGYEGYLNRRVATLPEILQHAGYRTYMSGKWNLGFLPEHDPIKYGFDRTFAMLNWSAGNFYGEKSRVPEKVPTKIGPMEFARGAVEYTLDGHEVIGIPPGAYATDVYVDRLLDFIDKDDRKDRPFFAYLAFTAPHVPIQVPDSWIERYRGVYDAGPEAIRSARIAKQIALKLFDKPVNAGNMQPGSSEWFQKPAEYREKTTRLQEVYAAQVEYMDLAIGRLIESLKQRGLWDNTVFVFLSDNGAANSETTPTTWYGRWVEENFDNRLENVGKANSELAPGPFWAQVGSAPFRKWKYLSWEGGVRVPAIFAGPGISPKVATSSRATVMDIAPTVLSLARVKAPKGQFRGRAVWPIDGVSLTSVLEGRKEDPHGSNAVFALELDGLRSVIFKNWKIVLVPPPRGSGRWELYDLDKDPGETENLAIHNPRQLKKMVRFWDNYVRKYGVILPEGGSLATW